MTNLQQVKKNLKLSSKLTKYLISNPKELKKFPKEASIVAFSVKDVDLNVRNNNLVKNLQNKGSKVIKAEETNNKAKPWTFAFI